MSDTARNKEGPRTITRGLCFIGIAADSNSVQVECDGRKIIRIRLRGTYIPIHAANRDIRTSQQN